MKKERGITLIALVITIIVLLILVTVSIQSIFGENGIVSKTQKAKLQTEIGTEREQLSVAYTSCKLGKIENEDEIVTASELETEMNNSYGAGTVIVTGSEKILSVKYVKTNRQYLILHNGVVVDLDEILANATYGVAIGLAEDGSLVDMSNWNYTLTSLNNEMYEILEDEVCGYVLGVEYCGWHNGYKGEIINGKIVGKVPAYILENPTAYGNGTYGTYFMPVISVAGTFSNQIDLKYAPQIPSTVISMYQTFYDSDSLIEAPNIPDSVIDMNFCFYNCNSLIEAPNIPEGVIEMVSCFAECGSLIKASNIPNSVLGTYSCFSNCSSLTGIVKIDATPIDYSYMFANAATNEGCDLVLTGSSTMLEELLATKSEESNIRIGN